MHSHVLLLLLLSPLSIWTSLSCFSSSCFVSSHLLFLQPEEMIHVLQISNLIFAIIFGVEAVLKLLALTWKYFTDRHNVLDFVIVIVR